MSRGQQIDKLNFGLLAIPPSSELQKRIDVGETWVSENRDG